MNLHRLLDQRQIPINTFDLIDQRPPGIRLYAIRPSFYNNRILFTVYSVTQSHLRHIVRPHLSLNLPVKPAPDLHRFLIRHRPLPVVDITAPQNKLNQISDGYSDLFHIHSFSKH